MLLWIVLIGKLNDIVVDCVDFLIIVVWWFFSVGVFGIIKWFFLFCGSDVKFFIIVDLILFGIVLIKLIVNFDWVNCLV